MQIQPPKVSTNHILASLVRRFLVAGILIAAVNSPAFAALYYVVQDIVTKTCRLSHIPPDPKTHRLIGVTAYTTKAEAKAVKHSAPACKKAISPH
jgi:hypothetical protein